MLNMCSVDDGPTRIIRAAIACFADRGFDATGVRAIADAAGVSAPLINHHFGSKEGLRRAVDQHVVERVRDLFAELDAGDASSLTTELLRRLDDEEDVMAYLRRSLQEGGPSGAQLVDQLVGATLGAMEDLEATGMVRPSADPLARALILLSLDLGSLLLEPHLARHLGERVWTDGPSERWFAAVFDLLANGLFVFPPPRPTDSPPPAEGAS